MFNYKKQELLDQAVSLMAEFKTVFGRELKPDFIAELYVSLELNLELMDGPNAPGYDAVDSNGQRYEIKERTAQNVDLNNFDFNFLILVNLDEQYHVKGMWKLSREVAQTIFVWREKFHKYQVTQDKIKANAQRIR